MNRLLHVFKAPQKVTYNLSTQQILHQSDHVHIKIYKNTWDRESRFLSKFKRHSIIISNIISVFENEYTLLLLNTII